MRHPARLLIALVLSVGVWSCGDDPQSQDPTATATAAAATAPAPPEDVKDDAIGDIKDSRYVVDKMALDEVSVNVYGDTAVSFTSQQEKSRYEGKDTSGHYHFTDTWVKKDGKWQVVASHGTRFDKPAAGEKAKAE